MEWIVNNWDICLLAFMLLEKAVKYVEEPNELDLGMDALKDMMTSQQREIDEIRNLIKRGK